jgi:hypothetical protein
MLFGLVVATPAEANEYCFTETPQQPGGGYDNSVNSTHCFETQTICESQLSQHRIRPETLGSRYNGNCTISFARNMCSISSSSPVQCFDYRIRQSDSNVVITPQPVSVCTGRSLCSNFLESERQYWEGRDWEFESSGCVSPGDSFACEFSNDPGAGVTPPGGGSELVESQWCYERRVSTGPNEVASNWQWNCFAQNQSSCRISRDNDLTSIDWIVRSGVNQENCVRHSPPQIGGSESRQYCFDPTHGPSKNVALVCFNTENTCTGARNFCRDSYQSCNLDNDANNCAATNIAATNETNASLVVKLDRLMADLASNLPAEVRAELVYVGGAFGGDPGSGEGGSGNGSGSGSGNGSGDDSDFGFSINDPLSPNPPAGSGVKVDCADVANLNSPYCLSDPLDCVTDADGEVLCERGRNTIFSLLYKITTGLMEVLIALSVIFIVWAGLRFVIARGNENKIKEAKQTLVNVLIGAGLIVGARILVEIVADILTSL